MADLELTNPEFDIVVKQHDTSKTVKVKPDETSDGVPYYSCYEGDTQITQVRLDEEGTWEQMWGTLPQDDIDQIGSLIDKNK